MEERHVSSCQIIYSILEQDPAKDFFPIAEKEQVGLLSRVPHASEALTGRYDAPPEFDESDHRSYRRHQWLSEALVKVDQVKFLAGEETGRTMSQAAIQFVLVSTHHHQRPPQLHHARGTERILRGGGNSATQ